MLSVTGVEQVSATGCWSVTTVTVRALSPTTGGTAGMCQSGSMTLANATPFGGVWTSSNTSIAAVNPSTGFVKGTGVGSVVIRFTITAGGCVASRSVTVNACREAGGSTVAVNTIAAEQLVLYPNPNGGSFTVKGDLAIDDATVTMEVVNMLGQVIYKGKAELQEGIIEQCIELGSVPGGVYMLHMAAGEERRVLRFVVQ